MKSVLSIIWFLLPLQAAAQFYHTGLNLDKELQQASAVRHAALRGEQQILPDTVSLRQYCPLPGNQLQMNTSPAWSVCWSAVGILQASKHNWTSKRLITKNTLSPAYTYQAVRPKGDYRCMAGTSLVSVLEAVKNTGGKKVVDYLEFCDEKPLSDDENYSNDSLLMDYFMLYEKQSPARAKIRSVKESLHNDMPVVVGMQCPPSFHEARRCWQPREVAGSQWDGHAMCVVGYDDRQYGGAFELLNSWGSEWGNQGYIWIRYSDFARFAEVGYGMQMLDTTHVSGLSGSLVVEMANTAPLPLHADGNGTFRPEATLDASTHFRLDLDCDQEGFVYAFGADATGGIVELIPGSLPRVPVMVHKNASLLIPGDDGYIGFDGASNGEYIGIWYSGRPPDIHRLHHSIAQGRQKVLEAFAQLIPAADNVQLQGNKLSFECGGDQPQGLLLIVDMPRAQQAP